MRAAGLTAIQTYVEWSSHQPEPNQASDTLLYALHRKKRFTSFPSPAGMSLAKLPLGRNNSVMTSLFPARESLVVTSRLGMGNYTVKKTPATFPFPAGMLLTKLSLAGNNCFRGRVGK
jgi:hypothetical protein